MGDEELWGEKKDKYTMADLEKWLDLKDGAKGKVLKKGKEKNKKKEKEKEKDTGKGKEKEGKEGKKQAHKKKE